MKAIVLAAGAGSRLRSAVGGWPKCMVEFGGRPYLWWLCRYLDAWGIGERAVVVNSEHRRWFDDMVRPAARLMFVEGFPGDPLPHLLDVLPDVAGAHAVPLLVVNANMLPTGVNPHDLQLPPDSDALGCIALGPLMEGWRTGFAVGRPLVGRDVVTTVVANAGPLADVSDLRSAAGMIVLDSGALLDSCRAPNPPRNIAGLLGLWATRNRLLARCYDHAPLVRFSTPGELDLARQAFDGWRLGVARSIRGSSDDVWHGGCNGR